MHDENVKVPEIPNDHLAKIVVEALMEEGLITDTGRPKALQKIVAGKASADDWLSWAEELKLADRKEEA